MRKPWDKDAPKIAVSFVLYEYDMESQSITGNCWRFNRIRGSSILAIDSSIKYLMFDVAPGYYAGGGTSLFKGYTSPLAFEVPAGQIVYLGDFIYMNDGHIDLRHNRQVVLKRNIKAAQVALLNSYPEVRGKIEQAKISLVPKLQMFLCGI